MPIFSFSLEVEVLDDTVDFDLFSDAVYENGGDDTLVCVSEGRMHVDYDREAGSYGEAVRTAIEQIESIGAVVVDIEKILPVMTTEEMLGVVSERVIDFADHAGRAAENMARAGLDFVGRFTSAFVPAEPDVVATPEPETDTTPEADAVEEASDTTSHDD